MSSGFFRVCEKWVRPLEFSWIYLPTKGPEKFVSQFLCSHVLWMQEAASVNSSSYPYGALFLTKEGHKKFPTNQASSYWILALLSV